MYVNEIYNFINLILSFNLFVRLRKQMEEARKKREEREKQVKKSSKVHIAKTKEKVIC